MYMYMYMYMYMCMCMYMYMYIFAVPNGVLDPEPLILPVLQPPV